MLDIAQDKYDIYISQLKNRGVLKRCEVDNSKLKIEIVEYKSNKIGYERYMTENLDTVDELVQIIGKNYVDLAVINGVKSFLNKRTGLCECSISAVADALKLKRQNVSISVRRLAEKKIMLHCEMENAGKGYVFNPNFFRYGSSKTYVALWEQAMMFRYYDLENEVQKIRDAEAAKKMIKKGKQLKVVKKIG